MPINGSRIAAAPGPHVRQAVFEPEDTPKYTKWGRSNYPQDKTPPNFGKSDD
jgi:hypothetical protein